MKQQIENAILRDIQENKESMNNQQPFRQQNTMKQQIENAILKAIGEDKEIWRPTPFPEGKEGILDSETVPIAMKNISEMRDNREEHGYNKALADLRSRAPGLAEEIVGIVTETTHEFHITNADGSKSVYNVLKS